jgi:DNA-binding CsgD family transcriptional regulator
MPAARPGVYLVTKEIVPRKGRSDPKPHRPSRSRVPILEIVELIYGAVDDPGQWNDVISATGQLLGATKGALHRFDHVHHAGSSFYAWEFDPDFLRSYAAHYSHENLRQINGERRLVPGRCVSGFELCPDDSMLKSDFAKEWLLPQDIFHSIGVVLPKEDGATWNLSFFRPLAGEHFGAGAIRLLAGLSQHFERAIQLGNQISRHATRTAALLEAIDRVDVGIILLDRDGHHLHVNRIANALLGTGDGIRLTEGRLSAESALSASCLREAIADALATASGNPGSGGGTVLLERSNGRRPLSSLVVPFRGSAPPDRPGGPAVLIFLTDPESSPASISDYLGRHFHLTPSECRLVAELLSYHTLGEAAIRMTIRENTARTHMKRILAKTGTRNQMELLRLLMKSIPALVQQPVRSEARRASGEEIGQPGS